MDRFSIVNSSTRTPVKLLLPAPAVLTAWAVPALVLLMYCVVYAPTALPWKVRVTSGVCSSPL